MTPAKMRQTGTTLVELIVALAILGLMAGVAGFAIGAARSIEMPEGPPPTLGEARERALATGRPVSTNFLHEGQLFAATALPDGRVIVDTEFGVDMVTGVAERQ